MSRLAIHVDGIGKLYRLGERQRYTGLRHRLEAAVRAPFRWLSSKKGGEPKKGPQELWALRDVSFDVQAGEVVGLIGRNGAGKSTLLKILSRVAQPTRGYAEIYGRVGSLLEVGTGFHQELTGRENVFLNGAVLGMGKKEIARKFDEIVAFAEVENFIDTPLKHYSTGMMMRLAFAVAAHIEPEILLVDEVLAVGDLAFQKKCLGKMGEVAKGGRTIIFVSHQMNQIRRLCPRAIWVDHGGIRKDGSAGEIVGEYEAAMTSGEVSESRNGTGGAKAQFLRWHVVGLEGAQTNLLTDDGPVSVKFCLKVNQAFRNAQHGVALYNSDHQLLWGTAVNNLDFEPGRIEMVHRLPALPLKPGAYWWRVTLWDEDGLVDDFQCVPEMLVVTKPLTHQQDEWAGILNIPSEFALVEEERER
jgi:lipopolysaccharide transport system ATP-binding protein